MNRRLLIFSSAFSVPTSSLIIMPQIANIADSIEAVDAGEQQLQIPEHLPVLPLRDIVIYPFMIVPLFVSREKSIRAVDEALGENRMILLASQTSRPPISN